MISLLAFHKPEIVTKTSGMTIMFPEAYWKSLLDCSPVRPIIVDPLNKI